LKHQTNNNLTNKPPEWEKIQTTNKMVNSNTNIASSLFQWLISNINETNIQIETATGNDLEALQFRLNWLETQLLSIKETYGKK
jgi:hypothetical protein